MPHSGYDAVYVDAVFAILDEFVERGKEKGYSTVVAGDFNAEGGPRADDEERANLGNNGIRARSPRANNLCTGGRSTTSP